MNFFDTSVFIAAAQRTHPAYEACSRLLEHARPANSSCALHSLAETYSLLSGHPRPLRLPPEGAFQVVEQMRERMHVISLTEKEYVHCIAALSSRGFSGGIVFDALLMQCARKVSADRIYTRNSRHFELVAPDLVARIVAI